MISHNILTTFFYLWSFIIFVNIINTTKIVMTHDHPCVVF